MRGQPPNHGYYTRLADEVPQGRRAEAILFGSDRDYWHKIFLDWLEYRDRSSYAAYRELVKEAMKFRSFQAVKEDRRVGKQLGVLVKLIDTHYFDEFLRDVVQATGEVWQGQESRREYREPEEYRQRGDYESVEPDPAHSNVVAYYRIRANRRLVAEQLKAGILLLDHVAMLKTTYQQLLARNWRTEHLKEAVGLTGAADSALVKMQDSLGRFLMEAEFEDVDDGQLPYLHQVVVEYAKYLDKALKFLEEAAKEFDAAVQEELKETAGAGLADLRQDWSNVNVAANSALFVVGGVAAALAMVPGVEVPLGTSVGTVKSAYAVFQTLAEKRFTGTYSRNSTARDRHLGTPIADPEERIDERAFEYTDWTGNAHLPGRSRPKFGAHRTGEGAQRFAFLQPPLASLAAATILANQLMAAATKAVVAKYRPELQEALVEALAASRERNQFATPQGSLVIVEEESDPERGLFRVRTAYDEGWLSLHPPVYLKDLVYRARDAWRQLGRGDFLEAVDGNGRRRHLIFDDMAFDAPDAASVSAHGMDRAGAQVKILLREDMETGTWSVDQIEVVAVGENSTIQELYDYLVNLSDEDIASVVNPHGKSNSDLSKENFIDLHYGVDWRDVDQDNDTVRMVIGWKLMLGYYPGADASILRGLPYTLDDRKVPFCTGMTKQPEAYDYRRAGK
jgi:hypothetical protein